MTAYSRALLEGGIATLLAIILVVILVHDATSQEPAKYVSVVTVQYEVPDIPKLEAKAIEILRRPGKVTGVAMTLPEAQAITRPRGVVDVARCWEYVSTDRLLGIVQAKVVHVTVMGSHP